MKRVLLLTREVENEQKFEKELYQLGCDVFTSSVLLETYSHTTIRGDFLFLFDYILLSETLATEDVMQLLTHLIRYPVPIFQRVQKKWSEAEWETWKGRGMSGCLPLDASQEQLKETLACERQLFPYSPEEKESYKRKRSLSSLQLSERERAFIRFLYDAPETYRSRDELCLKLFGKAKSASTLSQLSRLVTKLKKKLAQEKITGPIIETRWGKGYRLHLSVYQQVTLGDRNKNEEKRRK
jgi:Response regulators consisting of a CheY-like receiver domain and a winged-helix DNA-binding domain